LAGGLVAICLVLAAWEWVDFDWPSIHRNLIALDPAACIALMALLPVAGFSVGVVYLVAGAKFGPLVGGLVVAFATSVHLLLSHAIARGFLREWLQRFFARSRHRLPAVSASDERAVSVLAALAPGLPYFARNYLLALAGVPLRVYFWICLPLYVARSYVTILLGDLSGNPSRGRLAVLGAIYLAKLGVCAWLIRRLIKRHRRKTEL
jgi:uncharacterized membrane protein YdjX (TVP38/TMEM64 family)